MPPVQAAAALVAEGGVPVRLVANESSGTGLQSTVQNIWEGSSLVITQIDGVARNANPVQCFFYAYVLPVGTSAGCTFYYDSQSTGEGNGVWFSWRGALPLALSDQLIIASVSSATIQWSHVASGLLVPFDPNLVP
jgi:hypothetical protein